MKKWASANPSRGVKRDIKPRGIIVLDDDPDYLRSMVKMLSEQGFSPHLLFMDKNDSDPLHTPSKSDIAHFRRTGNVTTNYEDLIEVIKDAQANTLGIVSDFNLSINVDGRDVSNKLKENDLRIPFMINSSIGRTLIIIDAKGMINPESSTMAKKSDPLLSEWIKQSLFEQQLNNYQRFTSSLQKSPTESVILAQAKAAQSLLQLGR